MSSAPVLRARTEDDEKGTEGPGHELDPHNEGEYPADQALQWGLINDVSGDLETALHSHIEASSPVNPVAIQLARRLLNESFHDSFEDAIGHFLAAQQRAISHDQFLKTVDKHS